MQEVEYFNDGQSMHFAADNQRSKQLKHLRNCSYDRLEQHSTLVYNKCGENINYSTEPIGITSSDQDSFGSHDAMSYCSKLMEKPIMIKRFALGFLHNTEESSPLMCHNSSPTSPEKKLKDIPSEDLTIYNLDQIVSSRFGDSCKQSFAGFQRLSSRESSATTDCVEYEFQRNLIRQTNSASSSPNRFSTLQQPAKLANSLTNVSRFCSLSEQIEELDQAAWFHGGLPREVSLEVLIQQSPGAFLVRRSTTKHGCFALSLRVPPGPGPKVVHYLIMKTERGYKIKGFSKEFSSLRALITHHSVMPEMLPVPLSLARPQNIPKKCKHSDDYDSC